MPTDKPTEPSAQVINPGPLKLGLLVAVGVSAWEQLTGLPSHMKDVHSAFQPHGFSSPADF